MLEDRRLVQLHLQSVLQLIGLQAHQKTHGDGAHRHQQAQSDGETWHPSLAPGLGGTLAHRLTFSDRVADRIHGAILLLNPLAEQKWPKYFVVFGVVKI